MLVSILPSMCLICAKDSLVGKLRRSALALAGHAEDFIGNTEGRTSTSGVLSSEVTGNRAEEVECVLPGVACEFVGVSQECVECTVAAVAIGSCVCVGCEGREKVWCVEQLLESSSVESSKLRLCLLSSTGAVSVDVLFRLKPWPGNLV